MIDRKAFLSKLVGQAGAPTDAPAPAGDDAEGADDEGPGEMLLKAIEAKDADAVETAIKACVGSKSY